MMGKPNDGELCSCDGFEFNARKLRMLPCGCYGCVTVKKCMKTQFSIYNRKMVYIIFQVCVYIYMHVSIPGSPAVHTHTLYEYIYIYTAGLKVRIRPWWKYMDFKQKKCVPREKSGTHSKPVYLVLKP